MSTEPTDPAARERVSYPRPEFHRAPARFEAPNPFHAIEDDVELYRAEPAVG